MRQKQAVKAWGGARRIAASEARQNFSKLLNEVYQGDTPVIVEKSGIPVAAMVSLPALERAQRDEEQRRERMRVVERMRAAFRDVPAEEVEEQVAQAITAVRRVNRRSRTRTPRG